MTMTRLASRLALAAAVSLAAVQAQAATQVTFTGTVVEVDDSGYGAGIPTTGETITGTFTLSTSIGYNLFWETDGSTYADGITTNDGVLSTVQVTGNAWFSGGASIWLSGGLVGQFAQGVYRNASDYLNQVNYDGLAYDGSPVWNELQVSAYDFNGSASTLFTDPNGGLSFVQGLDLSGATLMGYFAASSATGSYSGYFMPTSFTVTSVPEPAGLALMLAGIGLVGVRARRRQQA